jgi:ribosomal protein S18 acetylase RimI-like enzyme/predicted double-glycine peptidase
MATDKVQLRDVRSGDLPALIALEEASFDVDRLSRRSFRHWIKSSNRAFIVATVNGELAAYVLVIYHAGTRLARLYSVAVDRRFRGHGIARRLIEAGEQAASDSGRFILRLEVESGNTVAIKLYESLGFTRFGIYLDYYEDHGDAIRMQKRIHHYRQRERHIEMPWIRQSTPFTCGPAALMMAMSAVKKKYIASQHEELQIWREATTIFMTSGHGGCHPLGLGLAAKLRGFRVEVWINTKNPLFVDSVRDASKKQIIEMVHDDYVQQAKDKKIKVHYSDIKQEDLIDAMKHKAVPVVMISTWRLDGKKAPHWVTVSGYDNECLYVHDPDPEEISQSALDCQYLPIAREDFSRISIFGQQRLRTAVIISR